MPKTIKPRLGRRVPVMLAKTSSYHFLSQCSLKTDTPPKIIVNWKSDQTPVSTFIDKDKEHHEEHRRHLGCRIFFPSHLSLPQICNQKGFSQWFLFAATFWNNVNYSFTTFNYLKHKSLLNIKTNSVVQLVYSRELPKHVKRNYTNQSIATVMNALRGIIMQRSI